MQRLARSPRACNELAPEPDLTRHVHNHVLLLDGWMARKSASGAAHRMIPFVLLMEGGNSETA
jgi:hypothetical protein